MTEPGSTTDPARTTEAGLRLISADVLAEPLEADHVSEALGTAHRRLAAVGFTEAGLWEAGPGTDDDVEQDELFLVLAGAGTITFDDGSVLPLRVGSLVQLKGGDRTTWVITHRLRKLYLS